MSLLNTTSIFAPERCITPSSSESTSIASGYSTPASSVLEYDDACEECGEPFKAPLVREPPKDAVFGKKFASLRTATAISNQLLPRVQAEIARKPLRVVGLLATDDSGCRMYSEQCAKVFAEMGVHFELRDMRWSRNQEDGGFEEIREAIAQMNGMDGLLVFFPLFDQQRLRDAIPLHLDIEGVHPQHLAQSYRFPPSPFLDMDAIRGPIYPCTPLAVVHLLQGQNIYDGTLPPNQQLSGRIVTVLNRSEVVGRPLAAMLANAGARVYSVDQFGTHIYERHGDTYCVSRNAQRDDALRISDIIISAVPGRFTVPLELITPGAICINVAESDNFGKAITERAGYFAPRMGKLTNLALVLNLLALRQRTSHSS